jgi:hypothetical protein
MRISRVESKWPEAGRGPGDGRDSWKEDVRDESDGRRGWALGDVR